MTDTTSFPPASTPAGTSPTGAEGQSGGAAAQAKEQAANVAGTAADQAASVAGTAKEQAANVAGTAAEQAKTVASEAVNEAKNLLGDARQQLRTQANEQSDKVATLVGDLGGQLRKMADAGDQGMAKDLLKSVADQAEQISSRLSEGGLDRTLEDARRLARNRPGLFLAGAAVAGFVAARVARTADTDALKQAVSPNGGDSNGSGFSQSSLGSAPDLTLEAAPRMAPTPPIPPPPGAPSHMQEPRPLSAQPASITAQIPGGGGPS